MNPSTRLRLAYCGLLWVGFALALRLLDRFALREDEAIYSYWALHFWQVDPYFLTVWPDKPPLFLWLLAGAFQLWGASQASGRLFNIMVTLLTALVVGATARRLWGQQSGLVATALYLFNPFALSFAPTVYTDPLLVLTGQLAFFCALTGRGLSAGLCLAAAIMTKQQGVFYAPLAALALWWQPGARQTTRASLALWWRFLLGILLVIAPIVYWDSTRWAVAPSPWDLSVRNYGGLALAAANQWLPQAYEWAKLLWYLTASWPVWLILTGAIIVAYLFCGRSKDQFHRSKDFRLSPAQPKTKVFATEQAAWSPSSGKAAADDGIDVTDLPGRLTCQPSGILLSWLALWCGGFLVLHIITTVQLWDRYLLPLTPPFCLLATWAFVAATNFTRQAHWRRAAGMVGVLCLLPPALTATAGALPIGGDHGAYNGLTAAIARLQQAAPNDAILYHQRLGWHYQFYLFADVSRDVYDLRWYPSAAYLAANAAQSPNRPRFLILPDWAPLPDLRLHLTTRRLLLKQLAHMEQMTLYAIQNQPAVSCVWCRCQMRSPWRIWPNLDRPRESFQP